MHEFEAGTPSAEAKGVVYETLQQLAGNERSWTEQHREDAASATFVHLLERAFQGRIQLTGSPEAFLRRCIRHRLIDDRERARTQIRIAAAAHAQSVSGNLYNASPIDDATAAEGPANETESPSDLTEARSTVLAELAPVIERAAANLRREADRPALHQSVGEMIDLKVGLRTPDEILRTHGLEDGAPAEELTQVRAKYQQRHKLARQRMVTALDDLREEGTLSAEHTDRLGQAILELRRCQRTPTTNVSGKKGSGSNGS